jgi:hypothetical protein
MDHYSYLHAEALSPNASLYIFLTPLQKETCGLFGRCCQGLPSVVKFVWCCFYSCCRLVNVRLLWLIISQRNIFYMCVNQNSLDVVNLKFYRDSLCCLRYSFITIRIRDMRLPRMTLERSGQQHGMLHHHHQVRRFAEHQIIQGSLDIVFAITIFCCKKSKYYPNGPCLA